MHTTSTRRSAVACLVVLGLTMASCSSAALTGAAPPDTAADRFGTFGGDSNQIPDGAETTVERTVFGGETTQVPASARTAADSHESSDTSGRRAPADDPVSVVNTALIAWSNGDRQAFDQRLAETAHWYGLPVNGEIGGRQFEWQWGFNTGLGASFSDFECIDSGRTDANSGGTVIECSGEFSDTRSEMMGIGPASFHAEYAVAEGQMVNVISFRAALGEEAAAALDFLNTYLTGLGDVYGQTCDPLSSSGVDCAEFILSHLPTAVEAWNDETDS